jgi:mono/diheme cytochrome c family protein
MTLIRMRVSAGALLWAATAASCLYAADAPTFDTAVKPILANTCSGCHNDKLASGGLNLASFQSPASLANRDQWEAILQKLRGGEMPPKGIPRPPQASVDALIAFVQGEFEKADRAIKPDPGRVVARRLNRNEYTNTIRDLLGVTFRADKDFPTDDSSFGFDNISEALTVSPVLIEKYLAAGEKIASAAIGADPLPKPLTWEGRRSDRAIRRIRLSTAETTHRLDVGAEYIVRVLFTGNPAKTDPLGAFGLWVDGNLLASKPMTPRPSNAAAGPREQAEEARIYIEAGDHVFRAGLVGDNAPVPAPGGGGGGPPDPNAIRPLVPETISIEGPFPARVERASRKKVLICDPNTGAVCVDRILTQLARRAYRRPPTKAEVAGLMHFYQLARQQGQSADQGVQLALQAVLVSPEFLFRIEHEPANGAIRRISDFDLASRLSYFLWTSMPDDRLLALAETGKLHAPETLDAEVTRMLADERSGALAQNFAGQWLEVRNLDEVHPDPVKFPKWSPDLRDAFKTETNMFFTYVLRENRPIGDFIDAKYTFVNELLAKHYGIPDVKGDDFRRVDLTGDQRGGLLSQGTVLTVSSYPTRTSVVLRGKYVLENILGTPPPPPPPDVPQLDDASVGATASLRQQMEAHRASAVCASCHSKMDVLGFGLENYDAIGAWRTSDGKFPVDSTGTLPNGKSFSTPAEMRRVLLANLPQFEHCVAEKMLTYALGRGLGPSDRNTLAEIDRNVAKDGFRFQSLIREVVHSMPFQMQHGELVNKQSEVKRPKEVASK